MLRGEGRWERSFFQSQKGGASRLCKRRNVAGSVAVGEGESGLEKGIDRRPIFTFSDIPAGYDVTTIPSEPRPAIFHTRQ